MNLRHRQGQGSSQAAADNGPGFGFTCFSPAMVHANLLTMNLSAGGKGSDGACVRRPDGNRKYSKIKGAILSAKTRESENIWKDFAFRLALLYYRMGSNENV
ncbi:hypothetical protein IFU00_08695 [Oxalobacteraceae sp. CFBP 8761]|nr:hypothetical protein [Oxalobacteraceae sp. CFBP 8761]